MRLLHFGIALLLATAGYADVITLKTGRVINGTYLGGTAREVRVEVGDQIETFDTSQIAKIEFGNGAAPAPSDRNRPVLAAPMAAPIPAPIMTRPVRRCVGIRPQHLHRHPPRTMAVRRCAAVLPRYRHRTIIAPPSAATPLRIRTIRLPRYGGARWAPMPRWC